MPAKQDDSQPRQVPWTEDLAWRALRVPPGASRGAKLAAAQRALEDGDERLPDGAVEALIKAGYRELA